MNTLERLKELEAKATPGPWYVNENPRTEHEQGAVEFDNPHGRTAIFLGDCFWNSKDAHLIVEMRNSLPKLLAFVEAYDNWSECFEKDSRGDLEDDEGIIIEQAFDRVEIARKALHK